MEWGGLAGTGADTDIHARVMREIIRRGAGNEKNGTLTADFVRRLSPSERRHKVLEFHAEGVRKPSRS